MGCPQYNFIPQVHIGYEMIDIKANEAHTAVAPSWL